ncbi:hypothetical protein CathTA2_2143 [Caldalkalibacillus thermarum TA2.A1]|uniref:Uncharacterized protein n=1 Tax=Caldalkalibacillus thermarum (strain TA2.A1) TaxID=986075 RepID=F5L8I8_CALTT|nr:hypothetical protein [Caldalkalibacillus thermarum]EGL82327.1 hypothetical protein CathTA2_2143 [Caldalkalibacillus thermarum TA2.A1]QZT32892.1 hypothetical protein HUR95_11120 [Caldalkalibacillus thermarum TA2.A1]
MDKRTVYVITGLVLLAAGIIINSLLGVMSGFYDLRLQIIPWYYYLIPVICFFLAVIAREKKQNQSDSHQLEADSPEEDHKV